MVDSEKITDACRLLAQCELPDHPPDNFSVNRLVGDASTRSYFRIHLPMGGRLILMKMPEPFVEDHFPYLDVYHLLRGRGISMASVHHMKPERGYVFLQDLGDDTVYEMYSQWNKQARLHRMLQSLNILKDIEQTIPASQLAFDATKFNW